MTQEKFDNIKFTFYGDLLGISNFYSIDNEIAKEKLNTFYNTIFNNFKVMAEADETKIYLFSDSIFITGEKFKKTIDTLGRIYYNLFENNIFLRGAFVDGLLDFDPRIEVKNLEKKLPSTDVLFRAISIEKSTKGARLLIEKELAKKIIPNNWLTDDLYRNNIETETIPQNDFRRKFVLSSEWQAYEYLWPCDFEELSHLREGLGTFLNRLFTSPKKVIDERLLQVPCSVKPHLIETLNVFKRSETRRKITRDFFKNKNKTL